MKSFISLFAPVLLCAGILVTAMHVSAVEKNAIDSGYEACLHDLPDCLAQEHKN